jgi:hypothetical protein
MRLLALMLTCADDTLWFCLRHLSRSLIDKCQADASAVDRCMQMLNVLYKSLFVGICQVQAESK